MGADAFFAFHGIRVDVDPDDDARVDAVHTGTDPVADAADVDAALAVLGRPERPGLHLQVHALYGRAPYPGRVQRLMTALGLTTVRALMVSWALSAVVLVVGLVLVITGSAVGFPVFVIGAAVALMTAFFMLRLRAGDAGTRPRRTPE